MCGIGGILRNDGAPADPAELAAMRAVLRHRGPDGEGEWRSGPVGLAHVRLALLDLAGGAQPIANEDGHVQVVCNGEIYNHLELRQGLELRGHVFRTRSDTEVLVHLYEEFGVACVEQLNGPFAFALWDARRRELLLARDRVGMRPLYWTSLRGRIAFASEVKALLSLPDCPREADPAALWELCQFWAPVGSRSVFHGIHSLPPAHTLRVTADGAVTVQRYWDWPFAEDAADRPIPELAQELRERLAEAVRLQRQADVPVGLYLSGGLDSSAIAWTASRCGPGAAPPAYALGFEDAVFDEGAAQREVAQALALPLQRVESTVGEIARDFPLLIWYAETPVVRTAATPLLSLARRVRATGVKAVLSGEGADELFAGYDLFKEAQVRRFMARAPRSAWRHRLLERLYPYLEHAPTGRRALAGAVWSAPTDDTGDALFAHGMRMRAGQRMAALWLPPWRERLEAHDAGAALRATLPADIGRWPALSQAQYVEAATLLSGYLLSTQGDRPAMSQGVELRHPFLDNGLLDWAARLPRRARLAGLREKAVLREAFAGRLPASITQRPKQPYRAPDSRSFFDAQGRLPDYARALLDPAHLSRTGWFDAVAVQRLVDKCRAGRAIGFADNMAFVMTLSTLLWREQFLDSAGPRAPERR